MSSQRWFLLPDLYRTLNDPDLLKRYASAYMKRHYPKWKPIKINNFRVLAEWTEEGQGK